MEDVNVGVTTFSSLWIIRLEFGFPICFYIEKSQNGFFSPWLESSFSDHFSFDKAGLITQIHQQLNSSKGS
jgi:hypothetical protein